MLRLDDAIAFDIAAAAEAADENIIFREVTPKIEKMIREVGAWQIKAMGVNTSFNVLDGRVLRYLDEVGLTHIKGINVTTRRMIVDELAKGYRLGEGTKALARRVRKMYAGISSWRAETIAKTEVTSATAFAREEAMNDMGPNIVAGKKWIATFDRKTRDAHRRLNRVVVPLNGRFEIDGDSATRPCGFSRPALNVNCRCTMVPTVPRVDGREDAVDRMSEAQQIKEFDIMYERYFKEVTRALRRGFAHQEKQVMAVVERIVR